MNPTLHRILHTEAPAATWLIRLMIGGVFLSEGIQKFLFASQRGAGRFERLGLPVPEVLGPFVGGTEILAGALVLLGCGTRIAAIPLIVIMLVALGTTKVPTLLDEGVWQALHDSRTDLSMLLGSIFLLLVGAGPRSVDHSLTRPHPH